MAVLFYKNMNLYFNVKITPAKITKAPIQGKWQVYEYIKIADSDLSDDDIKNMIGNKAIFSLDSVNFNKEVCKRPNFKVKVVDSNEYFTNDLKVKPSKLGISQDKVKIITISSNNIFFDEYIQINDDCILKVYDGVVLFLRKEGKVSNSKSNEEMSEKRRDTVKDDASLNNGLLLGLREKSENGYKYRTLFISDNEEGFSIKEMDNLLVPRKNGFLMLEVNNIEDNGITRDAIFAGPYNKDVNNIVKFSQNPISSNINYKILFVGNEYMSLENEELKLNPKFGGQYGINTYLSVVPLDNIYGDGIAFSKIIRNNPNDILQDNAEKFLKRAGKDKSEIDKNVLETNWGIIRENGKWTLRGKVSNEYFDVGISTPRMITSYDQLSIPFKTIKNKFPDAIDAYTSPNKRFLVVLTKNNLMVMPIENGDSIGKVKININLKGDEASVMSQWAMGSYVDEWAKMFRNK